MPIHRAGAGGASVRGGKDTSLSLNKKNDGLPAGAKACGKGRKGEQRDCLACKWSERPLAGRTHFSVLAEEKRGVGKYRRLVQNPTRSVSEQRGRDKI